MKGKYLTTAILAAMLVGSSAMASVARLAVMGTEPTFTSTSGVSTNTVNGATWYDDDYNVFYNPAYINDAKNYAIIEKGTEGGFFKSEFENFAYGIYVNRQDSSYANLKGPGIGSGINGQTATNFNSMTGQNGANVTATQRPIDLFFGGDTGIKWGAHLAWAYNRDQSPATATNSSDEITARYWHADLGATVMGLEPFVGADFATKYQSNLAQNGPNAGQEALNEVDAGVRYKYEGWTPYFVFHNYRVNGTSTANPGTAAGALESTTRFNVFGGGFGHDTKVADGVHIYKNLGFWYVSGTDDLAGTTNSDTGKNWKQYELPLNLAIEADATSWLTLRAGAFFDLWNEKKFSLVNGNGVNNLGATDRKSSIAGNATFRVGSTLKFGKLHIDSAFGNGSITSTGSTTGSAAISNAATNLDTTNVGFDSQLFALLSASYHW